MGSRAGGVSSFFPTVVEKYENIFAFVTACQLNCTNVVTARDFYSQSMSEYILVTVLVFRNDPCCSCSSGLKASNKTPFTNNAQNLVYKLLHFLVGIMNHDVAAATT